MPVENMCSCLELKFQVALVSIHILSVVLISFVCIYKLTFIINFKVSFVYDNYFLFLFQALQESKPEVIGHLKIPVTDKQMIDTPTVPLILNVETLRLLQRKLLL